MPTTRAAPPPDSHLREGYALISAGRPQDAVDLGKRLLRAHGKDAHTLVFASEAALATGDPHSALALIDRAIEAADGDPALKLKKASLLLQMRRRSEAAALASHTATRQPRDGRASWQAGNILTSCNRPGDAIGYYDRARSVLGEHPSLLYEMAVAQFFSGMFEDAERNLDRLLEVEPAAGHALYLRATLRRQTPERNHVADIERRMSRGFPQPALEASALYALAKELEDLGQHRESFDILSRAAARKRATLNPDIAGEIASLQAVCDAYSPEIVSAADGKQGTGAIFIVGMPRSGTTLVERLLVRSGEVGSAGELLDFGNLLALSTQRVMAKGPRQSPAAASLEIDFAALGREYLRGARDTAGDHAFFIDKMPVNFMYCGAIRKALPDARIIHLVRDPLDSCYAMFKTLFFSAYHFSYNLNELGDYYAAYRRMMRHWHRAMPGGILDVSYEDLVRDPATQSRRILEWCGVEWSPQVLDTTAMSTSFSTASAAQVREPVHTRSIGSSRKYLDRLGPLVERLTAAGLLADDSHPPQSPE